MSNQYYDPYLAHYGIKGMRWGARRSEAQLSRARGKKTNSDTETKKKKLRENDSNHVLASRTVKSAKKAVAGSATAIGTALIGSAAVNVLVKRGQTQTAAAIYKMSKMAVNEAKFYAKIHAGAAIVSGMMTQPDSLRDYIKEDRKIRKS